MSVQTSCWRETFEGAPTAARPLPSTWFWRRLRVRDRESPGWPRPASSLRPAFPLFGAGRAVREIAPDELAEAEQSRPPTMKPASSAVDSFAAALGWCGGKDEDGRRVVRLEPTDSTWSEDFARKAGGRRRAIAKRRALSPPLSNRR